MTILLKLKISPYLWEKEFAVPGFEKVVLARKSENAVTETGWSASGCFANVLFSIYKTSKIISYGKIYFVEIWGSFDLAKISVQFYFEIKFYFQIDSWLARVPKGGLQPWTMTLLTPLAYWATAGAGIAKFITRSAEHVTAPSHSQLKFHRNFLLKRFRNPSDSVAVYFFRNFKIVEKDIKCY